MLVFKAIAASILASAAFAAPALERRGPTCTEFIVPIYASAPTKVFNDIPANISDPTVLTAYLTSQLSGGVGALLGAVGTVLTQGEYNISMKYCEPETKVASRANTIQFLVHGLTYTKSYWEGLGYGDEIMYNWILYASQQGYPTLAIDQLGNGDSSHPAALLVAQQTLQVEIIHEIIGKLRAGTIPNEALSGKAFSKVLYVGHSAGSICGNAIATQYPTDVDTFVLTGYSPNFLGGLGPVLSGAPLPAILTSSRFASVIDPLYLAQTVQSGRQNTFYTNTAGYDSDLVTYDFDNEGTVSLGEIATLLYGLDTANDYTGNVLVVTGAQDAVVCGGLSAPSCGSGATSVPQQAAAFWPKAKNYTVSIPAYTGHSTTLHLSARKTFALAHQYLADKGF